MLNNHQIKLIQTAARSAGIRGKGFDGRYRMLLGQYKQPNGSPVKSCKRLNNSQLEDLLAICESHGWRIPGKPADYFRQKVQSHGEYASFAQQAAVRHLAGDLGWDGRQLAGMLERMTGGDVDNIAELTSGQAYKTIEALKAMFSRETGKQYKNLTEIQEDLEAKDGKLQPACEIG